MSASPANPLSERIALSRRRKLKATALSDVNQGILGVARDSIDGQQGWEFFCECGREDCHERVSLTVEAYSSLRDANGAVLAPGHRRSQLERARRLCEEAEALKRQGEHQFKRALRNVGSGVR